MRKYIIVFVLLAMVSCDANRYRISGEIKGAEGKMLYLEEVNLAKTVVLDSLKIKGTGKFSFRHKTEATGFYQLRIENKIISLLLEPGEKLELQADFSKLPQEYSVEGSDGSLLISRLNEQMNETRHSLDSLENLYSKQLMDGAGSSVLDTISKDYQRVIANQRNYNIVFILNFYHSLASLYALYQKIDENTLLFNRNRDVQYYKILSDSLTKYHPKSNHVKALQNNTKDLIAHIQQQKVSTLVSGIEPSLPDIALPTPERDTLRLSSLKGKVVILGFWSSGNQESIRQNLNLKPIYKKYHPKGLEIYQVSLDTSYQEWTRAIRFDELPWIHVSGLDFPNSKAAVLYNIQKLPTYFLIDPQQQDILGKDLSTRELEIKLDNLLK